MGRRSVGVAMSTRRKLTTNDMADAAWMTEAATPTRHGTAGPAPSHMRAIQSFS